MWRPGKAPALCVVWDRGSGPLPFRCRRYAANSMGCSLITYLITEECQQCVCFGKGAGGCAGTTSHSQLTSKGRSGGRAGVPWPLPPSFPGERAFPLAFWRRGPGAEEAVVILTRCWKINSFPIMLRQLWLQSSSSSSAKMWQHWGERWGKKEIMIMDEERDPENVPGSPLPWCSFDPLHGAECW